MQPGEIMSAFPRPGRALKAVLVVLGISALVGGILVNWLPGGARGAELLGYLTFRPREIIARPASIVGFFTSGIITSPTGIGHALWSIFGLYFLAPDLEKRWGGWRFVRFLLVAVCAGNLTVLLAHHIPGVPSVVRPEEVFGPTAALEAVAIAWGKENANRTMRLFFFLPMTGRAFMWITIGFAVVSLVFLQHMPEGAVAPIGAVAAGYLLSGSPSPIRAAWLRMKLGVLRRRAESGIDFEPPSADRPRPKRSAKGPPLRVVQGGLDDDLKNRKPPKDKRYLN